jgi:hypothetical protein
MAHLFSCVDGLSPVQCVGRPQSARPDRPDRTQSRPVGAASVAKHLRGARVTRRCTPGGRLDGYPISAMSDPAFSASAAVRSSWWRQRLRRRSTPSVTCQSGSSRPSTSAQFCTWRAGHSRLVTDTNYPPKAEGRPPIGEQRGSPTQVRAVMPAASPASALRAETGLAHGGDGQYLPPGGPDLYFSTHLRAHATVEAWGPTAVFDLDRTLRVDRVLPVLP